MNRYYILLISIITLALSACSDFVSPQRFKNDYYTLNAILYADSTISFSHPVWIGKVAKIEDINSAQLFVDNASVRIKETATNGDTMSFTLMPVTFPAPDMPSDVTFYIDPLSHVIHQEYTYTITVDIPTDSGVKHLWAETTVPKRADLVPNFGAEPVVGEGYTTDPDDTTMVIPFDEIDANYPVAMRVAGSQTVNCLVEVYCREDFDPTLEFTTPMFGQTEAGADMEDQYESAGESVRRINVLNRFYSREIDGNWYISLTDYRQCFVFYGRYRVTAIVMDDNYFKSKYMPESYFHGGVHNGFGCFGSASGGVMYTRIVK
jgi:hypothetical protein